LIAEVLRREVCPFTSTDSRLGQDALLAKERSNLGLYCDLREAKRLSVNDGTDCAAASAASNAMQLSVGADKDDDRRATTEVGRDRRRRISVVMERADPVSFKPTPTKRRSDSAVCLWMVEPVGDPDELTRSAPEPADHHCNEAKCFHDR
jgi:hypothetical protein